ncbi:MAG: hypothetical protein K1X57_13940 [Gemmataceae bacterium]|nr:hypothetical protein [Gemmataceae bacterium]
MNSLIIAHAGGKLDPQTATAVGVFIMAVGAIVTLINVVAWCRKKSGGAPFFGVFSLLFGYMFLADGQKWPGGVLAFQLLTWLFVVPLLLLPWLLWSLRKYLRAKAQEAPVDTDAMPEDRARGHLVPGEKLLWHGVPARRRFISETIAYVLFGLIPFSMASVFLTLLVWSTIRDGVRPGMLPGYIIGGGAALVFLSIGIFCFLYPFRMASRLREVVYAITDRRAFVLTSPRLMWNPVPARELGEGSIEFTADQVRACVRKWRDFGRTDLILESRWEGSGRSRSLKHYGLLGLDDPDEALQVIRENFPPPV